MEEERCATALVSLVVTYSQTTTCTLTEVASYRATGVVHHYAHFQHHDEI